MERQIVVFTLAGEHYGVDIDAVNSIVMRQPIASVPYAPDFAEGVTNLRGAVLPVLDLRKRFKLPAQPPGRDTRIVVVDIDAVQVGMIVDGVTEVLRVAGDNVEPLSKYVATAHSDFITGIAKVHGMKGEEGRLVILLDLKRVLSPEEQVDLQALQELREGEQHPAESPEDDSSEQPDAPGEEEAV
jgi:purine-binding chemotaxis protein CheW